MQTRSLARARCRLPPFPDRSRSDPLAVEEVPGPFFIGVVMEVREERFDHKGIRELYARDEYPLTRR